MTYFARIQTICRKMPADRKVVASLTFPVNARRPANANAMLGGFEANISIKAFTIFHLPFYIIMIVKTKI
jgi:hypothetical protein